MAGKSVAVIGGGLTGLTCAAYLARAGHSVTIFEKSHEIGGRARTQRYDGFSFNMGRHALCTSGIGVKALQDLGVNYSGGRVARSGFVLKDGKFYRLPIGLGSLLSSNLMTTRAKFRALRLFASLSRMNTDALQDTTVRDWLEGEAGEQGFVQFIEAILRVYTYSNDSEIESAGAAVDQMRRGLEGVLYVDYGWQTMVDGLSKRAEELEVKVMANTPVEGIVHNGKVEGVRLGDGTSLPFWAAILTVDPRTAAKMISDGGESEFSRWAQNARPVRAASLEVALSRLPQPKNTFVMGIDQPLYLSVHSKYAKLAPNGGATIHLMKCLGTSLESKPDLDRSELEALLDLAQPGWRDALVRSRFLPEMTVCNALITAEQGGMKGRPGPESESVKNLFFAGDWVGPTGMLSDACFASARSASDLASNGK